jgi:lysophospholipase L1-like esterase
MRRPLGLVVVAIGALVTAPSALAGYPNSMASTGNSITRAYNTGPIPFVDWPSNSWSTGSSSTVNSHYRRILAANPAIAGRNYNNAVTGADMGDLSGQVGQAVAQGVDYVTILIGANDVCASSEAAMTPVGTFRVQFQTAMQTLTSGLPDARVFVVSIPDVYRLWEIYRTSFTARFVWTIGRVCQSMLANPGSTAAADVARRARVRQRNIDYNTQLAEVCGLFVHCRFDGNAAFSTDFVRSDVSSRDYFHPSVAGQTKLAAVSWSATFDFTDNVAPTSASTTTPVAGGTSVTLTSSDPDLAGIEYRLDAGPYVRYTAPVTVGTGATLSYRAVDVNGNNETIHTLIG